MLSFSGAPTPMSPEEEIDARLAEYARIALGSDPKLACQARLMIAAGESIMAWYATECRLETHPQHIAEAVAFAVSNVVAAVSESLELRPGKTPEDCAAALCLKIEEQAVKRLKEERNG